MTDRSSPGEPGPDAAADPAISDKPRTWLDAPMPWDDEPTFQDAQRLGAYTAEKNLAWVRLVIITFNVGYYLLLLPSEQVHHLLAGIVSVVALAYALFVVAVEPYRRYPVLLASGYTMVTDTALIALWIFATGGILSPYVWLWAVSIIAITFRFGPRVTLLAAFAYVVADNMVLLAAGDLPAAWSQAMVRSFYIAIVGIAGGLLGAQWMRALREREELSRDLADREREKVENERFRIFSDAAMEGLLIHDRGIIVECNPVATEIFGYERDELTRLHVAELVHPDSWATVQARLAAPRDEPYEVTIVRKDGESRIVMVQARDIPYEGKTMRVTAVRDITAQREVEEARRRTEHQAQEIERLREVDQFKTQFINSAAHELNTPLTPLKLQLHVLRSQGIGGRPVDILERNLNRLATLVQDMLDMARLENGQIRAEQRPIDLSVLVDETVETFWQQAQGQEVTLRSDVPSALPAIGDETRVAQILNNLVSNALKFTPPGGQIHVTAGKDADHAWIRVEDTGVGMTSQQMARLFQPFTQVHDDLAAVPGTGLGLYICRKLAETMAGSIRVESPGPGKGTAFIVDLPARMDAVHPETEATREQALRDGNPPGPVRSDHAASSSTDDLDP